LELLRGLIRPSKCNCGLGVLLSDVTHQTVHVRRSAHVGKGLPTYWEPQAPAWAWGRRNPMPHTQAGAWGSQTVPTLERALPLPVCDRRSKQALTLRA